MANIDIFPTPSPVNQLMTGFYRTSPKSGNQSWRKRLLEVGLACRFRFASIGLVIIFKRLILEVGGDVRMFISFCGWMERETFSQVILYARCGV